ncbi:hydroxymethylbilane synthase [Aquimarina sp. RZ0]|uniref:hydroxymethylbilane synthase n=1 Tax=Aquimarina sp. RZ0 TaxID=2607730 RepID=UPI00165F1E82|nr:hydroxymethylbilane synthase [Aquimarina sp. RZ0]
MVTKTIRIGTRDSELALWQAHTVQDTLQDLGYDTTLIPVKSTGDIVLDKPLYELGITGIFTKTLDIAMLTNDIDIAVHSMKDVPTALPVGIVESAILERANVKDILVHKGLDFLQEEGVIATGSLRRQAQWLHKYPDHTVVDLRGNVNTRMQKLKDSNWNGAIFAAAGLERINLKPKEYLDLDWMIPAPAQGAMLVVAKEDDTYCLDALSHLNHRDSEICVHIERTFLRTLEGGCTAPIGALAEMQGDQISFKGVLFSLDGKEKREVLKTLKIEHIEDKDIEAFGIKCAQEVLTNGGIEIMKKIKSDLK